MHYGGFTGAKEEGGRIIEGIGTGGKDLGFWDGRNAESEGEGEGE